MQGTNKCGVAIYSKVYYQKVDIQYIFHSKPCRNFKYNTKYDLTKNTNTTEMYET